MITVMLKVLQKVSVLVNNYYSCWVKIDIKVLMRCLNYLNRYCNLFYFNKSASAVSLTLMYLYEYNSVNAAYFTVNLCLLFWDNLRSGCKF